MRPFHSLALVLVVLACGVSGCSSNNKGKIEGTKWSSDATVSKGQQLPAGVLSLEFTSDGKLVYHAGPQTFSGTYSLGAGDIVTMNLDQELSGSKVHQEKIVIAGNKLTMIDSSGLSLTFTKQ
jgi:hypothetical protein